MKSRGFTLVELVVAITISSIVVVFAAMFIGAPVSAYQMQSRRATLVADTSSAWPRMETDLRAALPNSLRWRRNGSYVVIEMLSVVDVARYMTAPAAMFNTAGTFRGITVPMTTTSYYLSVGNLGTAGANAYALSGSITPAGATIQLAAGASAGEAALTVNPAPVFSAAALAASPKHRIFLVSGPVSYLCDETLGTLRRYAGYPIALNQTSFDTPAEFAAAGATGALIAQGLTTCNFAVSAIGGAQSQTASARLTTTRNGDSVALLHSSHAEYLP